MVWKSCRDGWEFIDGVNHFEKGKLCMWIVNSNCDEINFSWGFKWDWIKIHVNVIEVYSR